MASGDHVSFEELDYGDMVWAHDPVTGETGPRPVVGIWPHLDAVFDIEVAGATVTVTEDHPFWNATDQTWEGLISFDEGDQVLDSAGEYRDVGDIDYASVHTTIAWDITVDDIHTFYVRIGDTDVLVHNCGESAPSSAWDVELDHARAARDALAEEVGASKATVTAGYDPATGRIAAGCNSNPIGCAENDVQRQLGIPFEDIQFTDAIRPRTGDPVPICPICQANSSPSQYPLGTQAHPDGPWNN